LKREVISSRSNTLVREARAVREGKERAFIFIEGVRLCEEALRSSLPVVDVLYTEKLEREARGAQLLAELSRTARRIVAVSEDVFSSVSDTKTPQGIVALAPRPPTDRSVLDARAGETPLVVLLHRVNNPSNAGAMLRVAEAAGANAVITTEGSTDIFSAKALRGAMGSSFRLPVWTGASFGDALAWCREREIQTVATDLRAADAHTGIDWTQPRAIIVGAEASGLEAVETYAADASIRIPMRPPVESLNVALALAVVLYEADRQRKSESPKSKVQSPKPADRS
jgi:TrmH family RNA methyltransferase